MSSSPAPIRRVLITGASRGIGREAARLLAERGDRVGLVARETPRLREAATEIGGHPFPADLSERASIDGLVQRVTREWGGPPDVIVNSAGAFSLGSFSETDPADLERQLSINLVAPFLLIRGFLPAMLARGSGSVIQIGSIAGRVALPGNAAYSASKYGLRGMHEVLAAELQGSGVRATLIEPAATDTALWDTIDLEQGGTLPSRAEMMRPEAVARAILYVLEQPPEVEVSLLALRAAR